MFILVKSSLTYIANFLFLLWKNIFLNNFSLLFVNVTVQQVCMRCKVHSIHLLFMCMNVCVVCTLYSRLKLNIHTHITLSRATKAASTFFKTLVFENFWDFCLCRFISWMFKSFNSYFYVRSICPQVGPPAVTSKVDPGL